MNILDIDTLRKKAAADPTGEDDALLTRAGDAAESSVLNYLNTSEAELYDTYGEIPVVVEESMYAVAVGYYEQPSGTDTRQHYTLPFGLMAALEHYKVLSNR